MFVLTCVCMCVHMHVRVHARTCMHVLASGCECRHTHSLMYTRRWRGYLGCWSSLPLGLRQSSLCTQETSWPASFQEPSYLCSSPHHRSTGITAAHYQVWPCTGSGDLNSVPHIYVVSTSPISHLPSPQKLLFNGQGGKHWLFNYAHSTPSLNRTDVLTCHVSNVFDSKSFSRMKCFRS